jgi:hypothetical protein
MPGEKHTTRERPQPESRTASAPASPRRARWSQQRRLEFIDFVLCWDGQLNRGDITDFFDISVPQASLDIAHYIELAPHNLDYDKSSRTYLRSERFRALYPGSAADHFLSELLSSARNGDAHTSKLRHMPPIAIVPSPGRTINTKVVISIQRAIRQGTGLRLVYQSLSQPEPGPRTITPHAFAHDGLRWHVRAYCHTREEFRDFVLARILRIDGAAAPGLGGDADADWNTLVSLVLSPHPKLNAAHRRAIELDYGMTRERVELRCRVALLFYVLRHLRLDGSAPSTPEAQQIVLSNRREIERLQRRAATPK